MTSEPEYQFAKAMCVLMDVMLSSIWITAGLVVVVQTVQDVWRLLRGKLCSKE